MPPMPNFQDMDEEGPGTGVSGKRPRGEGSSLPPSAADFGSGSGSDVISSALRRRSLSGSAASAGGGGPTSVPGAKRSKLGHIEANQASGMEQQSKVINGDMRLGICQLPWYLQGRVDRGVHSRRMFFGTFGQTHVHTPSDSRGASVQCLLYIRTCLYSEFWMSRGGGCRCS